MEFKNEEKSYEDCIVAGFDGFANVTENSKLYDYNLVHAKIKFLPGIQCKDKTFKLCSDSVHFLGTSFAKVLIPMSMSQNKSIVCSIIIIIRMKLNINTFKLKLKTPSQSYSSTFHQSTQFTRTTVEVR